MSVSQCIRRRPRTTSPSDLCTAFCSLYLASRGISTSATRLASTGSNNATPNPMSSAPPGTTKRSVNQLNQQGQKHVVSKQVAPNDPKTLSAPTAIKKPTAKTTDLAEETKKDWTAYEKKLTAKMQQKGGLASDSIFADDLVEEDKETSITEDKVMTSTLARRNPSNMAHVLNPDPDARTRWHRRAVIVQVRRRGRLTKEMRIARSERQHLCRSRFFRTSIKKLAPLARQIAGKPIDEAIVQMRFSKKKPAKEILRHLIQARDEAIVIKGMGLSSLPDPAKPQLAQTQSNPAIERSTPVTSDPSTAVPLPTQLATRELKPGAKKNLTDMYVSEAWVNRGMFIPEPIPRARGRVNVLRHPHTSISVVLKEEKTRVREKRDKEIKEAKRKLQGKIWRQLPDRPVTRQSQYVLW